MTTPQQLLGRRLNKTEQKYAPNILYTNGPMPTPLASPRVAVVGTRSPTDDGLRTAERMAAVLSGAGCIIISGLAAGIDAIAHHAAINSGGHTVGVLGTPLNIHYPKSNARLQDSMAANHLVVSQFPAGRAICSSDFVVRNRTIALLSNAVVICDAGSGRGTMHVGMDTLRLGRPLFIGGAAVRSNPEWMHKLLDGGGVITDDPHLVLRSATEHYNTHQLDVLDSTLDSDAMRPIV